MNLFPEQIKYDPNNRKASEFDIITTVLKELESARRRYPGWPADIALATAVMVEEAGEALKTANEIRWKQGGGSYGELRTEVIQTMAMCLRLLTETPSLVDLPQPMIPD